MPAKKKRSKGKSRKGGKGKANNKEEEEEQGGVENVTSLMNNITLALDSGGCTHAHGYPSNASKGSVRRLVDEFERELHETWEHFESDALTRGSESISSIAMGNRVLQSMGDQGRMKMFRNDSIRMLALACLASLEAGYLLKGDKKYATFAATVAYIHVTVQNTKNELSVDTVGNLIDDLSENQEREAVKFFSKKIPCTCLKEKWKQAKTKPKVARCTVCYVVKDKCEILICGQCKRSHYCSKDCQAAHWHAHQPFCVKWKKVLADYNQGRALDPEWKVFDNISADQL